MQKIWVNFFLLMMLLVPSHVSAQLQDQEDQQEDAPQEPACHRRQKMNTQAWIHDYLRCFFLDTGHVWKNIFSLPSLKVATAAIPLYLAVRPANNIIHSKFYDCETHTNKNQPCKFLKEIAVADGVVAIPFVAFNLYGFFSKAPLEFRRVQVFNAGLLSTWATKMVIKGLTHSDSYRPWHQDFSCTEQSPDGFPSGHAAMIAYLATYWALEKGYKWGLPLATYTLYAMAINVVTNHHYISQVFAGAAIGVLFGTAAHHTFQQTIVNENLCVAFSSDSKGKPALSLAYAF